VGGYRHGNLPPPQPPGILPGSAPTPQQNRAERSPDQSGVALQAERRAEPDSHLKEREGTVPAYPVTVTLEVHLHVGRRDLLKPACPGDPAFGDRSRYPGDEGPDILAFGSLSRPRHKIVVDDDRYHLKLPDNTSFLQVDREDEPHRREVVGQWGSNWNMPSE